MHNRKTQNNNNNMELDPTNSNSNEFPEITSSGSTFSSDTENNINAINNTNKRVAPASNIKENHKIQKRDIPSSDDKDSVSHYTPALSHTQQLYDQHIEVLKKLNYFYQAGDKEKYKGMITELKLLLALLPSPEYYYIGSLIGNNLRSEVMLSSDSSLYLTIMKGDWAWLEIMQLDRELLFSNLHAVKAIMHSTLPNEKIRTFFDKTGSYQQFIFPSIFKYDLKSKNPPSQSDIADLIKLIQLFPTLIKDYFTVYMTIYIWHCTLSQANEMLNFITPEIFAKHNYLFHSILTSLQLLKYPTKQIFEKLHNLLNKGCVIEQRDLVSAINYFSSSVEEAEKYFAEFSLNLPLIKKFQPLFVQFRISKLHGHRNTKLLFSLLKQYPHEFISTYNTDLYDIYFALTFIESKKLLGLVRLENFEPEDFAYNSNHIKANKVIYLIEQGYKGIVNVGLAHILPDISMQKLQHLKNLENFNEELNLFEVLSYSPQLPAQASLQILNFDYKNVRDKENNVVNVFAMIIYFMLNSSLEPIILNSFDYIFGEVDPNQQNKFSNYARSCNFQHQLNRHQADGWAHKFITSEKEGDLTPFQDAQGNLFDFLAELSAQYSLRLINFVIRLIDNTRYRRSMAAAITTVKNRRAAYFQRSNTRPTGSFETTVYARVVARLSYHEQTLAQQQFLQRIPTANLTFFPAPPNTTLHQQRGTLPAQQLMRKNTHDTSVHATVSESLIRLARRYMPATDTVTMIFKHYHLIAMKDLRNDLEKKFTIEEAKDQLDEIIFYFDFVVNNIPEKFKEYFNLKSWIIKIGLKKLNYKYVDQTSQKTLSHALALVWLAIHDPVFYPNEEDIKRLERLFGEHIYQIESQYKESRPDAATCARGAMNNVVAILDKQGHPDVDLKQIAKADLRLFYRDAGENIFNEMKLDDKKRLCFDINNCVQNSLPITFKEEVIKFISTHPKINDGLQQNFIALADIEKWNKCLALSLFPQIDIECNLIRFYQEKLLAATEDQYLSNMHDDENLITSSFIDRYKQKFINSLLTKKFPDEKPDSNSVDFKYYKNLISERFKQPFVLNYFLSSVKVEEEQREIINTANIAINLPTPMEDDNFTSMNNRVMKR